MTVEARLVDWLNAVPDVWGEAFMDAPETRPTHFVTVERTGGGEGPLVGAPLVAVQVWSDYRFRAAEHAGLLARHVQKLVLELWVARVGVNSVTNFPDLVSGHPRYQVLLELVTKFE